MRKPRTRPPWNASATAYSPWSGARTAAMAEPESTPTATSWRTSVPEATAADLENLLGTGMGAAQEQLERSGGFLPFALVMENDGEVRLVAVSPADADSGSGDEFD